MEWSAIGVTLLIFRGGRRSGVEGASGIWGGGGGGETLTGTLRVEIHVHVYELFEVAQARKQFDAEGHTHDCNHRRGKRVGRSRDCLIGEGLLGGMPVLPTTVFVVGGVGDIFIVAGGRGRGVVMLLARGGSWRVGGRGLGWRWDEGGTGAGLGTGMRGGFFVGELEFGFSGVFRGDGPGYGRYDRVRL